MDRVNVLEPGQPTQVLPNGKQGFIDKNLATGVQGTVLSQAFMNPLQETIMSAIEAAGLLPNGADYGQLTEAIRYLSTVPGNRLVVVGPATGTWTCPAFVYRVRVRGWSGGGGGGGAGGNAVGNPGGAGGFFDAILPVIPGQNYSYIVGAGGAGATSTQNGGAPGGPTSFSSFVGSTGGGGGTTSAGGVRGNVASAGVVTFVAGTGVEVFIPGIPNSGNGAQIGGAYVGVGCQPSWLGDGGSSIQSGSGNGGNGIAPGCSGAGAISNDGNPYVGGSGAPGLLIVEW